MTAQGDSLAEPLLNDLLRLADWRFLIPGAAAPRVLDLAGGRLGHAAALIGEAGEERADLVLVRGLAGRDLRRALRVLEPGGAVVCRVRHPLPGGVGTLRRRLRRAGFDDVHIYWPGPVPIRPAHFWLSLDEPRIATRLLSMRPARGRVRALPRVLWNLALRGGALAPLYAIGLVPSDGFGGLEDQLGAVLPANPRWLLLTGGQRSVNKVVGLPFDETGEQASLVVKYARVPEADAALEREAAALRAVESRRPDLAGVPRARALGRRCGRVALAETVIEGRPMIERLTATTLPDLARAVTSWLLRLSGEPGRQPSDAWWPRLVGEPLSAFERLFGDVIGAEEMSQLRRELQSLGDLPSVCEHRDCSPWNVVITADGEPALLDWESAEPHGLPGMDLAYFLASAAFQVDGALIAGSLDLSRTLESHARLLDPTTATGSVADRCYREYGDRLGIDAPTLHRLRLLCWVVHSHSEHRHLEMEVGRAPALAARRGAVFPNLVRAELARA